MSTLLTLEDGTEFDIRYAGSVKPRPVVVGSTESELEKLLKLGSHDKVTVDGKTMSYAEFQKRMRREFGGIAAYIPNPADYLKIANHL